MEETKIFPWRHRGQRWRQIAPRVDVVVEVIRRSALIVETVYLQLSERALVRVTHLYSSRSDPR